MDSALEENGFEISVPRQIGVFEASIGLGPIDVGAAGSSGRSSGSATDRAVSAAQGAAPTRRNEDAHAVGGGEASRN